MTVCDCLRQLPAILIAMLISNMTGIDSVYGNTPVYVAGVCAVLGHNFPIYFGFHGGKGILVSMVAMLFANWWRWINSFGFRFNSYGGFQICVSRKYFRSVLLVILSLIFGGGDIAYILFCVILAVLAVFMHRANIKRLINGTENKLGSKKG